MELSSSGPKYRDAEWAWPPTRGVACENLPTSCLLLFASSVIWGAARRSFPRKKTKIDATETPGTHDGSWGKSYYIPLYPIGVQVNPKLPLLSISMDVRFGGVSTCARGGMRLVGVCVRYQGHPIFSLHHAHRVRRVDVGVSVDTKLGFRCYLGSFT
ncbi:hypothetical protein GE21DRAFT_1033430 [Neurospora crassa]|nr:hypothetical protein GE21DRAFT_1033430 [Neurospora crassa]